MGIVAAQCRVFIAQNDICAPRPLYYHLFFLDNRRVPACYPPRRLPDSLPLQLISPAFHAPSRLSASLSSRKASRLADVFAICGRFRIAFRVSPVPFLRASLSFSRPFPVHPRRLRSRNRGGRGVPCRLMPCVSCRRSAPRFVFLRDGRSVSPVVAWGGEGGGAFYGMFHVKRDTSPFIFRCLTSAVRAISQACRAFPCDG